MVLKPRLPDAFKGRGLTRLKMRNRDGAKLDFAEAVLLRPGWKSELEQQLAQGNPTPASTPASKPLFTNSFTPPSRPSFTSSRPTGPLAGPGFGGGFTTLQARGALMRGNYQEAIRLYDEALKANPNEAEALGLRGLAKQMLGLMEEGQKDIDEAVQKNPSVKSTIELQKRALELRRR
jgi:tetratricopeptide (TPR) repeat protein